MSKLQIKSRFGVTPNSILNSKSLSFKAKGLFGFLQSKPDGWRFSVERIAGQSIEGRDSVRTGLQELEEAGFLKRVAVKTGENKWGGYDYQLSDSPLTENTSTGNTSTAQGDTISKKDSSKKEIVRESESSPSQNKVTIKEVWDSCKSSFADLQSRGFDEDSLRDSLHKMSSHYASINKRLPNFGARFEGWVLEDA